MNLKGRGAGMKIGVDVRALYLPNMKGIGIYLKNLLSAISEIDSGSEFHLYYDGRQQVVKRKPAPERFIEKELIIPKGDTFYFWEQFKLPSQLRKEKLDVFHSPANTTFLMKSCPVVVTVHDTTVQEIAHGSFVKELYFKKVQPFLLRKAEKIIAPSNSSKNNIVNILKVDPEKVVVIYQGLNQRFRVINDPEAVEGTKTKLGIAGPYILFTGGESVWKNISRLIEAYAMLKRRNKISEKLIVTGIRSQEILAKHMREIERLKITSDVSVLGYLNEDDLVSLYNGARVFVYPSLKEGFGFPPLEAMACGVPVAASNAASIPEVVGEAALLFDGENIENMSDVLFKTLTDKETRSQLIAKGFGRVRQFTWEKTARETIAIYKEFSK